LQEITYSGSGSETSQLDSYSIAGHLLGETNGTTTTYDLTDAQGTILLSLTASAIQGEQAYDPYGNLRYTAGTIGTDKGYTGQFADTVTGLDYYNARWYNPVIGMFLSPDSVQGNSQGLNPYAYVLGNPETMNDPTGHWGWLATVLVAVAVVAVVAVAATVVAPILIAGAVSAAAVSSAAAAGATGAALAATATTTFSTTLAASALVGGAVTLADAGLVAGQIVGDRMHGKWSSEPELVNAGLGEGLLSQIASTNPFTNAAFAVFSQAQQASQAPNTSTPTPPSPSQSSSQDITNLRQCGESCFGSYTQVALTTTKEVKGKPQTVSAFSNWNANWGLTTSGPLNLAWEQGVYNHWTQTTIDTSDASLLDYESEQINAIADQYRVHYNLSLP
jgi:RHS repeat-associated protein